MRLWIPKTFRLAVFVAVLGCGGDETAGPAPDAFTVAIAPTAVSVLAGSTKSVDVSVTRLNGFTGDVKLTAENLPAGIEVVLPSAFSLSIPTAPMHVIARANVSGQKTFTIRATAAGKADKTADVTVMIAGESVQQYTMDLSVGAVTIKRGLTGTVFLHIVRDPGFTTAVPFECSNVPAGVHVYPTTAAGDLNNPVTGFSAVVVITTSPSAYPTTYFLKCYGLVADVAVKDVDLRLVIEPPPLLGRSGERAAN